MAYSSITKPELHLVLLLIHGNGTSPKARTGVGFKPDWVWIKALKNRNSQLQMLRGVNKIYNR